MKQILILASKSPRRKEILEKLGINFRVFPSDVNENINFISSEHFVQQLAVLKANEISNLFSNQWVLAADTVVSYQNKIFGKPASFIDAKNTLLFLQGKSHQVYTGIALQNKDLNFLRYLVCKTNVCFKSLTEKEIEHYLKLVNVLDKAGSYAIQEHGDLIIDHIDGSFSNVMGLPEEETDCLLKSVEQCFNICFH